MYACLAVCAAGAWAKQSSGNRADVPWVSLAHQRKLDAERAEREAAAPRAAEDSKGGKSADGAESKKSDKPKAQSKPKKGIAAKLAEGGRPELTADKFDYAADGSGVLYGTGNVRLGSKSFEIKAGKISFAQKSNSARVLDDVRISIDKARVITSAADISIDGKTGNMDATRFGTFPLFVAADKVSAKDNKYVLDNSTAYFNEPAFGSFSAKSSKMTYNAQTRKVLMEDTTFRVGPVPFLYLPEVELSVDMDVPFDIETRVETNGDYGLAWRNTVHYTGFEDFAPGILLDGYTKRSVLVGPALRYEMDKAENFMSGFMQFGYINDTGDADILGVDSLGRRIDKNRYFFEMRHNQLFNDRVGLNASISAWSDEFVTRDFREDFFYDNQIPDNFAEATYYGDMWTASLFTRFAPNNFELVQQRLPEARVDFQPIEVASTGAYLRGYVSAEYLRQYNPDPSYFVYFPADSITAARFDGYVGLDRPVQLSDWAKITPVAGARLTSYASQGGYESYTRVLGQVGFDAQMDVWGQFDFQSKTMGIDGIRHHLIPMVSYRYIPSAGQGRNRVAPIDIPYYTTSPSVLDLGSMRDTDYIDELNTMRLGVRNVFETRDGEFGSRELARLDVFEDLNFNRRVPPLAHRYWSNPADEFLQSRSDLFVNAQVSPARWLNVGTITRFSFEHSCVPEINNYITLLETDIFSLTVGSAYLKDYFEQYYAQAEYKISERYRVRGSWHYDAELSDFVYQRYAFQTRIGNTWLTEFYISHRVGSTREDNTSFGVTVRILGL